MITLPDRLPSGFDHQLNRACALTMDAFKLSTREEMLSAGSTMGITTSDGTFVITSEHDQDRLVEWTVFHIRRGGKPLIQILLDRMPANADTTDRAILTAMASSSWGLYRIDDSRSGIGVVVTDLWRGTVHRISSRVLHQSARLGDHLVARLFTVEEITTMAVLISKLPNEFIAGLRKVQAQGFLSDVLLAQGGDAQDTFAATVFATRPTQQPEPLTAAGPRLGQGGMPGRNSGRNRNQPCPCGSGRKFKTCCGRG